MPPTKKRPAAAAVAPAAALKRRPAAPSAATGAAVVVEPSPPPQPPRVRMANGVEIPMVGFGTAFFYDGVCRPDVVYSALPAALDAGYRHIDSANMYGCERQVGQVLGSYFMSGRLKREGIFITTKVGHPPTADYVNAKTQYLYDTKLSAHDGVLQEFYECVANLGVGYVDLLLLHWPGMFDSPDRYLEDDKVPMPTKEVARRKRVEMWAALEHIYRLKLARAIGVSNFVKRHLDDILPSCKVTPMMNQIEVHPYLPQEDLIALCYSHGIEVTAYSPLAGGKADVVRDPIVVELAAKKGVDAGQLVLSWLVQRGIVVIPKSANPQRVAQNLRVSSKLLTPEEMQLMASLDRGLHTCPDPTDIP